MLNLNQPTFYSFNDSAEYVDLSVNVATRSTSVTQTLRLYKQKLVISDTYEFKFDVAAYARKRFAIRPQDYGVYYSTNYPLVTPMIQQDGDPDGVLHYRWHKVTVTVTRGEASAVYNFYNMPAGRMPTSRVVGNETFATIAPWLLDRTRIDIGTNELPIMLSYLTTQSTLPSGNTIEHLLTYRDAQFNITTQISSAGAKPPAGAFAPIFPDFLYTRPIFSDANGAIPNLGSGAVTCDYQAFVLASGVPPRIALTNMLTFVKTCNADTGDTSQLSEYAAANPYTPTSQQTGRRLRVVWLNSFGSLDVHTIEVRKLSDIEGRQVRQTQNQYNQPVMVGANLTSIYEARITATEQDWAWMQWIGSGNVWIAQSAKGAHALNYLWPYMPATARWSDQVQTVADGVEYTSARLLIELPTHKFPTA